MAITENLRSARLELWKKERDRKKWIGISKTRHGAWVTARQAKNPNPKTVAHAFNEWKASIAVLHQLDARINALRVYLDKGAIAPSFDLAKAVAVWEGGRGQDGLFHPYHDAVGVWTIGYGHTNADGAPQVSANTRPLTAEEATVLLLHDLSHFYAPAVLQAFRGRRWKANQKMFDALTSFAYNLGPAIFAQGSMIGNAMSTKSAGLVAHTLLAYDHAGGQVLLGLQRRRQWERQLFLGGTYAVNN